MGGGKLLTINSLVKYLFGTRLLLGQYVTNRNFGDALSLIILNQLKLDKNGLLFYRYCPQWIIPKCVNLQMIGSMLHSVDSRSILCGAGAVAEGEAVKDKPLHIISVRGPLTRNELLKQGIDCPERYGDPAMLLPKLYQPNVQKCHKVGFIPHYVDHNLPQVEEWKQQNGVHFINILLSPSTLGKPSIYKEWKRWIDDLCSCEIVVSSSLHGLILAEAYGIPTLWVKFSDEICGNDFKYRDYYASIGYKQVEVFDVRKNGVPAIEQVQQLATKKDTSLVDFTEWLELLPKVIEQYM